MRPLDFLGRMKVKLGIVMVGAVVTAFVVNEVGINGGVPRDLRIAFAVFLALLMMQVLARGMTKPLREMAAAAQTIAKGSYGLRVTATSRDEVGELARAFNAMAADLAEVDRQRRELVANVSHELRTPITGVQAVLENVVDGVSPPEPEILGTALAQTQRLGRLVAQLLDLSRLDSGARPIEAEEFDLADLGGQAVREASLRRDDVTVVAQIEPGRHLTTADPSLLAQVLANLLDNAVRHSPPGGTVTLTSRASTDGTLEIEVADEGPGIPPADRQRVFERFSRLDAARAADAGGAGLGLAIAKEIAELHGGTLAVADGTGCHMVVTLPKAVREPAPAGRTLAAGRTPTGAVHARLPATRRSRTDTEAGSVKNPDSPVAAQPARTNGSLTTDVSPTAARPAFTEAAVEAALDLSSAPAGEQASPERGGVPRLESPTAPASPGGLLWRASAPAPNSTAAGESALVEAHAGPMPTSSANGSQAAPEQAEPQITQAPSTATDASQGNPFEPATTAITSHPTPAQADAESPAAQPAAFPAEAALPISPTAPADAAASTDARPLTPAVAAHSAPVSADPRSLPGSTADEAASANSGSRFAPADPVHAASASADSGSPTHSAVNSEAPAAPVHAAPISADFGSPVSPAVAAHSAAVPPPVSPIAHAVASTDSGSPVSADPRSFPALAVAADAAVPSADSGSAVIPAVPARATPLSADSGLLAASAAPAQAAASADPGALVSPAVPVVSSATTAQAPSGEPGSSSADGRTTPASSLRTAVTAPHPVVVPPDDRPPAPRGDTTPGGPPPGQSRQRMFEEPPPARSFGGAVVGGIIGALAGLLGGTVAAVFFGTGPNTEVQAAGAFLLFVCVGIAAGASLGGRVRSSEQAGGQFDAYTPPPLFPRPALPDTPSWVLPAAMGVGLVAAVCFPYAPTGIGVVLTAVALTLAVVPAIRHRVNAWSIAYSVAAYGLVSVALFRDADWLVGLSLLAAFAVASLAVSGGRGWAGVVRGLLSVGLAVFPVPWFLGGPVRRVLKRRSLLPVLVSLGVTAILLAVFGVLFVSADAVFSSFARELFSAPAWAGSLPVRIFLFVVFGVLAAAAILVALRPVVEPRVDYAPLSLARTLWIIPLVGVNLLFAAFVGVQISVLFGGSRRVLETAGLTFAEYARSGFFELITVSVFVLFIVAFCSVMIKGDRWIRATLLGLLCALTLVILASALHRLGLYTAAYGFTRLRASVGATIWWVAAVFVLVLLGGLIRPQVWLPKALVLLTAVSLLVFAVWNPDAQVAETQVSVRGVDRLDAHYLGRLSADAIPGLDRLPEPIRSCVLRDVIDVQDLRFPDPWNGWNLSRRQAAEILAAHPVDPSVTCEEKYRSAY
ncbi:DUF4153 domain-containing protein [Herbidospora daliensis]|uniref:DUF4153 domain-containing protein n=1 Tax=Herbidospora daliensis TaxID=295585 RepID=UPI000A039EF1|nr:DUF4153 domain-containing protein [Herbidospora daliensis]